jgi:uncharacterized membrane protein
MSIHIICGKRVDDRIDEILRKNGLLNPVYYSYKKFKTTSVNDDVVVFHEEDLKNVKFFFSEYKDFICSSTQTFVIVVESDLCVPRWIKRNNCTIYY